LSSPKKKIKIELEDNEGDRYNLSLEGKFSKEKMIRVFELIESFEDKTTKEPKQPTSVLYDDTSTLASRIWSIIQHKCHDTTFTSAFIFNKYNEIYEEKLQLSVISTYLSRFFARNKLSRIKHGKEWIYSMIHINDNLSQSHDITYHYDFPTVYDLHQ
jgi:hypothetical protein